MITEILNGFLSIIKTPFVFMMSSSLELKVFGAGMILCIIYFTYFHIIKSKETAQ